MKQPKTKPKQIEPCPKDDDADRGPAFNPASEERGPTDHQADCQQPKKQAS